MKKIIISLIIFMSFTSSIYAEEYEVPENIGYYEFCYFSGYCEVPEELQKLINRNIMAIMLGIPPIY